MLFVTKDWELANDLRKPRGFGHWGFSFDKRVPDFTVPADANAVFWVQGTFAEAKKAARAEAKRRNAATVWVLP